MRAIAELEVRQRSPSGAFFKELFNHRQPQLGWATLNDRTARGKSVPCTLQPSAISATTYTQVDRNDRPAI